MKAAKELLKNWRKEAKISFIFDFIFGFTNYFVDKKTIPESQGNGCVTQTRC